MTDRKQSDTKQAEFASAPRASTTTIPYVAARVKRGLPSCAADHLFHPAKTARVVPQPLNSLAVEESDSRNEEGLQTLYYKVDTTSHRQFSGQHDPTQGEDIVESENGSNSGHGYIETLDPDDIIVVSTRIASTWTTTKENEKPVAAVNAAKSSNNDRGEMRRLSSVTTSTGSLDEHHTVISTPVASSKGMEEPAIASTKAQEEPAKNVAIRNNDNGGGDDMRPSSMTTSNSMLDLVEMEAAAIAVDDCFRSTRAEKSNNKAHQEATSEPPAADSLLSEPPRAGAPRRRYQRRNSFLVRPRDRGVYHHKHQSEFEISNVSATISPNSVMVAPPTNSELEWSTRNSSTTMSSTNQLMSSANNSENSSPQATIDHDANVASRIES